MSAKQLLRRWEILAQVDYDGEQHWVELRDGGDKNIYIAWFGHYLICLVVQVGRKMVANELISALAKL